jgi:hypothetical protein
VPPLKKKKKKKKKKKAKSAMVVYACNSSYSEGRARKIKRHYLRNKITQKGWECG